MKSTIKTVIIVSLLISLCVPGIPAAMIKNSGLPDYSAIPFTMKAEPSGNFTKAPEPSTHFTTISYPEYYDEIIARARAASGIDPSYDGEYAQGSVFVRFTATLQEGNDRISEDATSVYYNPRDAGKSFQDYWDDPARITRFDDATYLSGYIRKFSKSFQYQSGIIL
ncbi:MAG: hypothetical protein JXA44_12565 [Methanospirillaceae archaeon]|nr:hypothetical protein [Methanospirillaceae archaeon]